MVLVKLSGLKASVHGSERSHKVFPNWSTCVGGVQEEANRRQIANNSMIYTNDFKTSTILVYR